MDAIFRHNKETGMLDEQPRIKEPEFRDTVYPLYKTIIEEGYQEHLASLRHIPTDFKDWPTGDLIEGKDFEIKNWAVSCKCGNYFNPYLDGADCWNCLTSVCKERAVPLPSSQSQESNQGFI